MKIPTFEVRRARDPRSVEADLLVLPVVEGAMDSKLVQSLDRENSLGAHAQDVGFRGQEGKTLIHRLGSGARARAVLAVGFGRAEGVTPDAWRKAGGAAARAARGECSNRIALFRAEEGSAEAIAAAEGFALASYAFDRYRKSENGSGSKRTFVIAGPALEARALRDELSRLGILVAAVYEARDLVNEPPSRMSARILAERAAEICKRSGVSVEVMGPKRIRALGLEGLIAVNRGSVDEPRFVRMRYRPRGRARVKVALIGKGITFDSGGLSLKPAKSMETMKIDMAGAAAVIGTMSVIGRLKPSIAVTGYFPATDNLPSGSAQRPGDVIRYRNGKTVEVMNTDAEGRLVLADALALASEEQHDVIIDVATLTGACVVALGQNVAGIMGNKSELVDTLVAHGRDAGEALWPLPLVKEYRDDLKSSIADMKNVGGPHGGAITAGLFLQEFVDGAAWAHLDIAGPAFAERDLPYSPRGATGFGVRTLTRYLMGL